MKNTITSLLAVVLTATLSSAATFSATFDGSDTTFLVSNVAGNTANLGGPPATFFFLNITDGSFGFDNASATIGSATNSSSLSTNSVTSIATWIADGTGAQPAGALDGLQIRFATTGAYEGDFAFTIVGQDYSAFDGNTVTQDASSAGFGGTFGDAVPEPTSSALLGLGALGLLARRKRG